MATVTTDSWQAEHTCQRRQCRALSSTPQRRRSRGGFERTTATTTITQRFLSPARADVQEVGARGRCKTSKFSHRNPHAFRPASSCPIMRMGFWETTAAAPATTHSAERGRSGAHRGGSCAMVSLSGAAWCAGSSTCCCSCWCSRCVVRADRAAARRRAVHHDPADAGEQALGVRRGHPLPGGAVWTEPPVRAELRHVVLQPDSGRHGPVAVGRSGVRRTSGGEVGRRGWFRCFGGERESSGVAAARAADCGHWRGRRRTALPRTASPPVRVG